MDLRARLTKEQIARLNDAAGRNRIAASEIARRASRKYRTASLNGVVVLPKREETTREGSQSMRFVGVEDGTKPEEFGQMLDWYLSTSDKGAVGNGPTMEGRSILKSDGTVRLIVGKDWQKEEESF
jgi:hypothetical protein